MCQIFTEMVGINMGNDSAASAPRTTCTSTKRRITQGCEVTAATTTLFDSCTRNQTATDFTKYCTESVSPGVTYTPCTKTVSTVFEGCSVTATTTSVIDDVCQTQVTLAPDDPQGEFGTLPANASNETCPYFPGVNITVLDDQGSDGQKQNDTCPMPNGTRTSFDDDQGDDEPRQTCKLGNGTTIDGTTAPSCPLNNATLIQGPDGAEDGNVTASCPLNNTIDLEPDGALDGDSAPACNLTLGMNMTMEQDLGQGEDGLRSNLSCPIGGNSTLEVDNEQGEDSQSAQDDLCPVIPNGVILSPLADLGDYASVNESSCPVLDSRYPISWLDEQGDDWQPEIDCNPPSVEKLGRCALVLPKMKARRDQLTIDVSQDLRENVMLTGRDVTSWSCSCADQTAGQVVTAITKCGTAMCPNWQTTSTRTTTEIDTNPLFTFTDPTLPPPSLTMRPARCSCIYPEGDVNSKGPCEIAPSCADSDCAWPTNTNLGRCTLMPVQTLSLDPGAPGRISNQGMKLEPYPDIDYCRCQGQGTTMIEAMPNCDGSSCICINQNNLVLSTWDAASMSDCPTELPRLPFFEACGLTTFKSKVTSQDFLLFDNVQTVTWTICTCNKVTETGKDDSTYVISTVARGCDGGYMCHNSVGFVAGKPKAHKRLLEQASTATVASPLLAVTTDATPGSVPMAAGPTGSVAG
jgi:hypothetical protein